MSGIDEIAQKASVSKTAVSFALNDKPGISEATRSKILKIAKQMGFQHRKKNSVRPGVAGNVGFIKIATHGHIVNRDHDVFIADYIYGISQECKNHNLDFTLFESSSPDLAALNALDLKKCSGLIILGTELSAAEITNMARQKIPTVFLDTYFDFLPYNFVTMNNRDALLSILTLLKNSNLTDVKMISTKLECANFREREKSYLEVMEHLGLPVGPDSILKLDSTFLGAYSGMNKLLLQNTKLPEAFICANDIIALGCIKAIKENGLKIPQDISITGFDDLPGSSMMDPALTSYQVPKEYIGKIGTQILVEATSKLVEATSKKGKEFSTIKTKIDGKLIVRDSTP